MNYYCPETMRIKFGTARDGRDVWVTYEVSVKVDGDRTVKTYTAKYFIDPFDDEEHAASNIINDPMSFIMWKDCFGTRALQVSTADSKDDTGDAVPDTESAISMNATIEKPAPSNPGDKCTPNNDL